MAFSDLFGKKKTCPLDQSLCNAREANRQAAEALMSALAEPPRTQPVALPAPVPLRAARGRR